ncbi:GntR family transcriptional regulator [Nocardia neocaledoniensis NBRC 108232]|uniref:GntR family transcriptional regulator n=1 Tax=Nocardia neocaledoniensis TaxID=236511 RepID=UPI000D71B004|nr:GntR family transcriptional regulator [Nocardia neocaledoniensis]GEM31478.1 GntR family transcriptional regulator [Nocardia neocaledoniensis NBRC 108232]
MPEIEEVLPKYLQIAGYLRDQIVRGDLAPGAELPSERELAATWRVARPTATKALRALRQQGFVEARQGAGTFVRAVSPAAPRARERYERAAAMGTMYSDAEQVEFPFVGVVDAPAYVAAQLGVGEGERVVRRQRVISNVGVGPIELSTSWFPAAIADAAPRLLLAERLRGGTVPYVADALGLRDAFARDQVSARLADEDEQSALGLPNPSAVLIYWLVAFDSDGTPVEFDEAVYPQERWAFRQDYPIIL